MERCEIIRDLLPVYADGLASEATIERVEEHLAQCEICRDLLAQMKSSILQYDPVENAEFRDVLKKQRSRSRRKIALASTAAALAAAVILTAVLWREGVFFRIGSYESPNGQVKTTVYSRDITDFIPKKDHFTLVDKGAWQGTTVLWGMFDGLWWSRDSKYQVVSLMDGDECWLMLFDFVRNAGVNLDAYLTSGIYGMEEFQKVSRDQDGREQIEFRFLQWSQYDSSMLIYFSYVDTDGIDRDGHFWYSYPSGTVTGIMFLENAVVDGVVKEIGVDFYLIDLDQTDENGNTLEFVFTTSDTTQLRGLQTLTKGEHIRVVCHGPKEYAQRPWEFAFGNVTDETMPAAISVTALP